MGQIIGRTGVVEMGVVEMGVGEMGVILYYYLFFICRMFLGEQGCAVQ